VASPKWTVERHLEAGSDEGRELWRRFADVVAGCGEHSLSVAKKTARSRGQSVFVHHFRISEIDDEFAGWIHDSYEQVGCGRR
jgi:hypothetical protein